MISKGIAGVSFTHYNSADVKRVSAVQVKLPLSFDAFQIPVTDGLYDPRMGFLDALAKTLCKTCGQTAATCPGHFGHISLPVPVFHPLLFQLLSTILRAKCSNCHRFKLKSAELVLFRAQFKLLFAGKEQYLPHAQDCFDRIKVRQTRKAAKKKKKTGKKDDDADEEGEEEDDDDMFSSSSDESDSDDDMEDEGGVKAAAKKRKKDEMPLQLLLDEVFRQAGVPTGNKQRPAGSVPTTLNLVERTALIRRFFKTVRTMGCPHCKYISRKVSRDGFSKLLLAPLSQKSCKINEKNGFPSVLPSVFGDAGVPDEEDDVESDAEEGNAAEPLKKQQGVSLMMANEAEKHIQLLYAQEPELLSYIWGSAPDIVRQRRKHIGSDMFFLKTILVPPSKFRPPMFVGGLMADHPQNTCYRKILQACESMGEAQRMMAADEKKVARQSQHKKFLDAWIAMQEGLNEVMDSTKAAASNKYDEKSQAGIRQMLEAKQGLFRKNMMGKRVNFAARSVISPDPFLHANQIGIPLVFAKELTYPTPVTAYNVAKMRELVTNGAEQYPGANFVQLPNGPKIDLRTRTLAERITLSRKLMVDDEGVSRVTSSKSNLATVYRHLATDDVLLVNRQPTLHKVSMMAHKARVFQTSNRTIRMHYANCKSYNADFDGDEMNLHFPQNELGRAEAYNLMNTDNQYIVPTSGAPVRGLIQDHVVSGVVLTKLDAFFTRAEFQQLFYSCARDFIPADYRFVMPVPCIIKPQHLYSGKQLLTAVLRLITGFHQGAGGMTFRCKTKTPGTHWGPSYSSFEGRVLIKNTALLHGILDKAAFGATKFGLMHAVFELFGPAVAGNLLTCFGRLFTLHMQSYGHTCGVGDLLLRDGANKAREETIKTVNAVGLKAATAFAFPLQKDSEQILQVSEEKLRQGIKEAMTRPLAGAHLDSQMSSALSGVTSKIIGQCLPHGQVRPFPENCMALMISTGAKGSDVNFSQISCLLGQQALEGRRVPLMGSSSKTLPSFRALDPSPRAGGYITDRFLTGIRPQEYYFHCMAGREGLVDTAVKTSRSGYLQRCLVKHLESLIVGYDYTVRNTSSTHTASGVDVKGSSTGHDELVSFNYGEDSIDTTKASYMQEFDFFADNQDAMQNKLASASDPDWLGLTDVGIGDYVENNDLKKREESGETLLDLFSPGVHLGCVSESFQQKLTNYVTRPDVNAKLEAAQGVEAFEELMKFNYRASVAQPGENVGVVAAQSIGEPSTQMTLNTFHLAGHGGANVTLGIPRLRELLQFNGKTKTMIMELPLRSSVSRKEAEVLAESMNALKLQNYVQKMTIHDRVVANVGQRQYRVRFQFPSMESWRIKKTGLTFDDFCKCVNIEFAREVDKQLKKVLKNLGGTVTVRKVNKNATPLDDDEKEEKEPAKKAKAKKQEEAEEVEEDGAESSSSDDEAEEEEEEKEKEAESGSENENQNSDNDGDDNKADENEQKVPGEAKLVEAKRGLEIRSWIKDKLLYVHPDVRCNEEESWVETSIAVGLTQKKVLMMHLVEDVLKEVLVRSVPGISSAAVLEDKGSLMVQLSGINFPAVWKKMSSDDVVLPKLGCNDITTMLHTYGVEAARASIIKEISAVFGVYGIKIDRRHFNLVADYMTWEGKIRAFNRFGLAGCPSLLQRITFESSLQFLLDACNFGEVDVSTSPSTRIVLGQPVTSGTGSVDLFQPIV